MIHRITPDNCFLLNGTIYLILNLQNAHAYGADQVRADAHASSTHACEGGCAALKILFEDLDGRGGGAHQDAGEHGHVPTVRESGDECDPRKASTRLQRS
jgi:hypothetical protein